mgnify:CR=1 FL=1
MPRSFDSLSRSLNPVGGQIVQHDDIARARGRAENMLDTGLQNLAVHGALMYEVCGLTRETQAGGESGGFPVPMRSVSWQNSTRKRDRADGPSPWRGGSCRWRPGGAD